jgi:hypothetical protein
MRQYAGATALAIALITMLALTVSASMTPANAGWGIPKLHEEACDAWAHGLRVWAIRCHCNFECRRQYSSTVTLPCASHDVANWSMTGALQGRHEGLCDVRVVPSEPTDACFAKCVGAKNAAQH